MQQGQVRNNNSSDSNGLHCFILGDQWTSKEKIASVTCHSCLAHERLGMGVFSIQPHSQGQPGNEATIYLFIKHMIVIILVMQILHLSSLVELVTVGWWPTPCWGTQAYRSWQPAGLRRGPTYNVMNTCTQHMPKLTMELLTLTSRLWSSVVYKLELQVLLFYIFIYYLCVYERLWWCGVFSSSMVFCFDFTDIFLSRNNQSCPKGVPWANFPCQGWFPPKPLLVGTVVLAGPNLPIKTSPETPGVQRNSPPAENCRVFGPP